MTDTNEILTCAISLGEQLLYCGAEVSRVEDSITRICNAYGVDNIDVFAIPSLVIVTASKDNEAPITQTRRVLSPDNNLDRVEKLNSLSRYICQNKPAADEIEREIKKITSQKPYGILMKMLTHFFISSCFCIFFGGHFADAGCAGVIGLIILFATDILRKGKANRLVVAVVGGAISGALAVVCTSLGIAGHSEFIIIGNIMLLIPGVAMTNGMRDLMASDTLAGLLRLCEAILIATCIALGAAVATNVVGGLL